MGRIILTAISWMCFLVAWPAWAGTITAHLRPETVAVNNPAVLTIRIQGGVDEAPRFPNVPGLTVLQTQQSQSTQIINMDVKIYVDYHFVLNPERKGAIRIPPIAAKVDGKTIATPALILNVVEDGTGTTPSEQGPPRLFAEREFSNPTPHVGEPVVMTVRLFVGLRLAQQPGLDRPTLQSFRILPAGNPEVDTVTRNEREYQVLTLREVLVPLSSGTIEIAPHKFQTAVAAEGRRRRSLFDDFFEGDPFFGGGSVVQRIVPTKSATLKVLPLPAAPGGTSGAVGEFRIESQLSTPSLQVGDTATFTVTLSGEGNLAPLADLPLTLPDGLKAYPDKPIVEENVTPDGRIEARKTFKYALIARNGGSYDVGGITIPIFNPRTKSYDVLEVPKTRLTVEGTAQDSVVVAAPQGQPMPQKDQVRVLKEDIVELHRNRTALRADDVTFGAGLYAGLAGGLPPVAALALMAVQHLRRHRRGHAEDIRRSRASREFSRRLKDVLSSKGPHAGSALFRAFQEYLGDKTARKGQALTSGEVRAALVAQGFPEDVAEQARRQLLEFERREYSGGGATAEDLETLAESLRALVRSMEKSA